MGSVDALATKYVAAIVAPSWCLSCAVRNIHMHQICGECASPMSFTTGFVPIVRYLLHLRRDMINM